MAGRLPSLYHSGLQRKALHIFSPSFPSHAQKARILESKKKSGPFLGSKLLPCSKSPKETRLPKRIRVLAFERTTLGQAPGNNEETCISPRISTTTNCACHKFTNLVYVASRKNDLNRINGATPSFENLKGRLGSYFFPVAGSHADNAVLSKAVEPSLENPAEKSISDLWLYNTRSRKKELFKTKNPGQVGMYVCGVTAYDFSHIGHARVYVAFDVLYRFLLQLGYDVKYVRNFTDVDDKIIKRASELGQNPVELSARFCEEFQADMAALGNLPPTVEPKVTEHIDDIIALISKIIDNGYGYCLENGDVYFEVSKFQSYGELSGRQQDEIRSGERVAVDERKRNASDFALWKSTKPGEEVSWKSPWGLGRPGWHIECSAMSAVHLGPWIDIHGGGQDLVFPHHENELAQSKAADSACHVSTWCHNGFVTVEKEKMSKSLGNFFTIREVLARYHPLALRWFLLGTHYRSPINYSQRQLDNASDRVYYLLQILEDAKNVLTSDQCSADVASQDAESAAAKLSSDFFSSMADDLHTSLAVAALSEPLKAMNDLMHTKKGRKDKTRLGSLRKLQRTVLSVLDILGLPTDGFGKILDELKALALKRAGMSESDLQAKLSERASARVEKNFAKSDEIREELAKKGIMLMDGGDTSSWRPASVDHN